MGEHIPTASEQAWLIEKIAALVEAGGPAPLRASPLVVDGPLFFPDPWEATVGGLRRLARRIVKYGGLRDLDVDIVLEDDTAPPPSRHQLEPTDPSTVTTASCRMTNVVKGRCRLTVTEPVADRKDLVRELAREAARAYRRAHGFVVLASEEDEERAVDVTAVYLGLGALAARASVARLSPQGFGFLLGVRAIVRREGAPEERATAALLDPPTATSFRAALELFGADAEGLARNLGLSLQPDSDAMEAEEIVDDVSAEIAADEKARASRAGATPLGTAAAGPASSGPFAALAAAAEAPRSRPSLSSRRDAPPSSARALVPEGVPVFRLRRTRARAAASAAFLLGLASAVIAVIALGQGLPFALGWTAAVTIVGLFLGRFTAVDVCSNPRCGVRLSPDDTECPGCDRHIVAVMPFKRER